MNNPTTLNEAVTANKAAAQSLRLTALLAWASVRLDRQTGEAETCWNCGGPVDYPRQEQCPSCGRDVVPF